MSIKDWKFSTTDNGTFFWEAMSAAGELLGRSSQNFKSQNGAKYNADLLGRSGSFSKNLNWDFTQIESKEWDWKCNNTINKENVGSGHQSFATKLEAVQNAVLFGYKGDLVSLLKKDDSKSSSNIKSVMAATPAVNVNVTKKTEAEDNYNRSTVVDEDEGSSWWKWLLLALLILGLLWWLLPMLTNKSTVVAPDIKPITISSPKVETPKFDWKTALSSPKFSTISGLISAAGLGNAISQMGPSILLAPSNDAFAKVPQDILSKLALPEQIGNLQAVLKGHILPGNVNFAELKDGDRVKDLNGDMLPVSFNDGKLFINQVEIDQSKAEQKGNFKIYEIPSIISDVTFGSSSTSSSSSVAMEKPADVMVKSEYKDGGALSKLNADGNFTLLLKAINTAELKDALEADGPFTIFAPNDNAILYIEPAYLELFKPENKARLVEFLKQHVVPGKNTFEDFRLNKEITNLNGKKINLKTNEHNEGLVQGPGNSATAPIEDIEASNGIVHILTDNPLYI
jgi:transforming growth factor-beta-induced protein